jgi:hypothetical protein
MEECTLLETLDLSSNHLTTLPGNLLRRMSRLADLRLRDNKLTQLPGSFAHLVSLESLDVSYNELMTLALCPVVQNVWDEADESGRVDDSQLGCRDWMKFIHPETGAVSYYNLETHESRRAKPAGFLDDDDSRWTKMLDATTHEAYWYNLETRETSWETPPEILERWQREMKVGIKESARPAEKKARDEQLRLLARVEASTWEVARQPDGTSDFYTDVVTKTTSWEMPAEVDTWDKMTRLHTLRASRNRLAVVPESLTRAPALAVLDVAENLLQALPRGFSNMPALREFNFSHNQVCDGRRRRRWWWWWGWWGWGGGKLLLSVVQSYVRRHDTNHHHLPPPPPPPSPPSPPPSSSRLHRHLLHTTIGALPAQVRGQAAWHAGGAESAQQRHSAPARVCRSADAAARAVAAAQPDPRGAYRLPQPRGPGGAELGEQPHHCARP